MIYGCILGSNKLKHSLICKLLKNFLKQFQSVLHQTASCQAREDILTSIQEQHAMANRIPQSLPTHNDINAHHKKQGVSAESSEKFLQTSDIKITKYDKDFR